MVLIFISCQNKPTGKLSVTGTLAKVQDFKSQYIPQRDLYIWLPSDYQSSQSYPVLYMFDGQMLFDSTTTWNGLEWGVDEVVTGLIAEQKISSMIVVGLHSGSSRRHAEYFPQKAFELLDESYRDSLLVKGKRYGTDALFSTAVCSDDYLKYLVEEVKPYVDKNYNTLSDIDHTYIAGSSMGGLMAMYAFCEYPKIFGAAICMSTHWIGTFNNQDVIPKAFESYIGTNLSSASGRKIYFDHGTATLDSFYAPYQKRVNDIFKSAGYNDSSFMSRIYDGHEHSERDWNKRLHVPLVFISG